MKENIKINKQIDKIAKEKGLKITHTQVVAYDMSNLYLDPNSILHCSECHKRLGILHTLRSALFKKPGTSYIVKCKACKHPNVRIKGQYKSDLDKQWADLHVKGKP